MLLGSNNEARVIYIASHQPIDLICLTIRTLFEYYGWLSSGVPKNRLKSGAKVKFPPHSPDNKCANRDAATG